MTMLLPYGLPLCVACRHLRPYRKGRMACQAFPLGVPNAIVQGRADHREPFPGDDGMKFSPDPDVPVEVFALLAAL